MCMMSAVFDNWRPAFPPVNVQPNPYPWTPQVLPKPVEKKYTLDELKALLEGFRASEMAAQTFDDITGQPDCEDPEKAKLLERIEALERKVGELSGGDSGA